VEVKVRGLNTLDLRLYRAIENKRYWNSKMPRSAATLIGSWWKDRGDHGQWKKAKRIFIRLAISMSSSHVHVKELDVLAQPKMVGWSRPVVVAEALAKGPVQTEWSSAEF